VRAETLEQALQVLCTYSTRWIIEEYHKAWKTGAGVERAQLHDASRLAALAAILALVAVRLLTAKFKSNNKVEILSSADRDMIAILEARYGTPKDGWTENELLRAIARLGGFLARKGDGHPGWQAIWRGWMRLAERLEGYKLARERCG
jgi:hypothetical protein